MASFLRPCIYDAAMVRFMSKWDIPDEVICDPCKERIADDEAERKKRRASDEAKRKKRRKKAKA